MTAAKLSVGGRTDRATRTRERGLRKNPGFRQSGVLPIGGHREQAQPAFGEHDVSAWSRCSQRYDVFAEEVTGPYARDAARLVSLRPGVRCLDVAAGTGAFSMLAAEAGAEVLATDFSPCMIRQLQKKCQDRGLEGVSAAVMDGQQLEVPENSFDVAASVFGLIFFPQQNKGLSELHRVLKPGGKAVVVAWGPPAKVEMMRLMGEALMGANLQPPDQTGGPPPWTLMGNPSNLRRLMLTSGFEHVHLVSVTHLWTFERSEYLAELLSEVTPSASSLFRSLSPSEKKSFLTVLAKDFVTRQGFGPYGVTSEALIAIGTKAR